MQSNIYRFLRELCFYLGFISIIFSIKNWSSVNEITNVFQRLEQQNLALFVGLWAPTFFIISSIFDKMVDKRKNQGK
jgi:Na+/H+ antiporter NhaD/arsenite permease-like protein